MSDPAITIDPGMRSGQPCLNGSRLTVEAVAGMVWAENVDTAMDEYDLDRRAVLVCCWFAGSYGLPGRRAGLAPGPLWRRRWGAWAQQAHHALWSGEGIDDLPDPPRRPTSLRGHSNDRPR